MIPEKMKAIIITEPRKAEVREITTPHACRGRGAGAY